MTYDGNYGDGGGGDVGDTAPSRHVTDMGHHLHLDCIMMMTL